MVFGEIPFDAVPWHWSFSFVHGFDPFIGVWLKSEARISLKECLLISGKTQQDWVVNVIARKQIKWSLFLCGRLRNTKDKILNIISKVPVIWITLGKEPLHPSDALECLDKVSLMGKLFPNAHGTVIYTVCVVFCGLVICWLVTLVVVDDRVYVFVINSREVSLNVHVDGSVFAWEHQVHCPCVLVSKTTWNLSPSSDLMLLQQDLLDCLIVDKVLNWDRIPYE